MAVLLTFIFATPILRADDHAKADDDGPAMTQSGKNFRVWFVDAVDVQMDIFKFPKGPVDNVVGNYGPPVGAGLGFRLRGMIFNVHGAIQRVPGPDIDRATGVTPLPIRNVIVAGRVGWEF